MFGRLRKFASHSIILKMVKVHHCKFFFFFLPFWLCVCHLTLLFFLLFFLAPLFCGNFGMKLVVKLRNWSHDWRLWVDVGGCLIREISFYLILYIQWRELADYRIVALDIAATWEHFLAVSLMSSDRLTWHRTPFIPHSLIFYYLFLIFFVSVIWLWKRNICLISRILHPFIRVMQ